MKRSASLLVSIVTFCAGFGTAWWLNRTSTIHSPGSSTPLPVAVPDPLQVETSSMDSPQSKVDARELVASPQLFLDSLRGQSSLLSRSRITAAIAALSLGDIQQLATKTETMGYGGTQRWELISAVYERWAELDAEGLFTKARAGGDNRPMGYAGIHAAFRQFAARDPETAWKRAQDIGAFTQYAKQSVLTTIGELDPARALSLALEDGGSRRESWLASSFMRSWVVRDATSALAAFEALPVGEFRAGLAGQMAETYAAIDPDAALTWGRNLKNPAERHSALSEVIQKMASDDPHRVLALAEQPEFSGQRREAIATAVAAWARRDFEAAFAHTMKSGNLADQQAMLQSLNQNATSAQREKLLEVAGKFPPSVARSIYASAVSDYTGQVDPGDVIAKITSPGLREDVIKAALNNYYLSPDDRRELFSKLQPTSQTTSQAADVARRLGWSDPAGALKWAESLTSADLRKSATTAALSTWAGRDPASAAQQAATLTDPAQRDEAIRSVSGAWGARDEKAALAWADGLPGVDRAAALGALVNSALHSSPDQAQRLYEKFAGSLDPDAAARSENRNVARSVAGTLTENNPQQAIAWANGLAGSPAQNDAFAGIAEKWAGYDAVATSEWISGLPAGEGRDLAADRLVSVIARDDPESAWSWALSIADTGKRREAAARTLAAWKAYGDKDSAHAALNSAGFADDDFRELSKKLE